ncbi:hypothetical protein [Natronincola ferrireducens]|uniref:Uncharacterized protein n=1 Tax=Natronincola ferrireducens TaxID=393762 RepID=A0A1G9INP7_9FIRM|nr:hypothetical protein [Natronincola ferrireducens]SDL26772.1 hypothetical protein SAMN05660472_02905 [Natronincola ferrireducens]
MNQRGQAMLIVVVLLGILLIVKSLWFDPVGGLEGEKETYRVFAQEVASLQNTSLLERWGLLTYRVMFVLQEEEEGITEVMYRDNTSEEWITEVLEGQYRAKVRAYLLYTIPMKDIHIKGGIQEWKQH